MEVSLKDLKQLLCCKENDANSSAQIIGGSAWKIVVADRGFVLHGRVSKEGEYVIIEDCSCIRYWGTPSQNTDSGLGYLAKNGATKDTKVDSQPTTRIHELQIVQLIDCVKQGVMRAN